MTAKPFVPTSPIALRELVILLLASIACVTVLTVAIARSSAITVSGLGLTQILLLLLLVISAVSAAYLVWRTTKHARLDVVKLREENLKLRHRLTTAESVIGAEPQILMYWEIGGTLQVVSNTLSDIPGLPVVEAGLLSFSSWLDPRSSRNFEAATRALFQDGRPFNMILKTNAGGNLEADGRASAGRAVMRLRDIAGYKREISRINATHEALARDIRASRSLLNALPMPAWLQDFEGRLTWVNNAYVQAVEALNVDDVVLRQIELLERRQRQTIAKKLASGKSYRKRLPIIIDGERRTHDVIVVAFSDGFAGAAIDIAEIESAQGELDRQVEANDWTLDRVATGVAIFNPERKLVYSNPAFHQLWDLDPTWLKSGPRGVDVFDRLRAQDSLPAVINYSKWRNEILRLEGDGDQTFDDFWPLPGGRLLHVVSEHRKDGSITFLFKDESEQLALKSQFNEMIRVQSETLNSLTDGVAVFATDGRLKLHNRAFAMIWKLSPSMLEGEPHIDEFISVASVLFNDRSTWSRLKRVITAFSDMRTPLQGQMVRPDHSVIDFASTPLPDGATLLTFVDVTDSKRYERALVERNEALLASDRMKNQFIGNVSYELRTPLTNIIGFSEFLESPHLGELSDKQREYVQDISYSSKTLLSIIDGILDLATIDAGDLELRLETIKVKDVIDGAIEGIKERAARAGLTIDVAIAEDAEEVIADKERVQQIIYNLLTNAVGFSNDGGEVRVTCYNDEAHIVLQVEDHGIGISHDVQAKVFDRFMSDGQGSKHRGAGLGLSIIKNLVELHGGSISLDSEPGKGTTVTVRLPRDGKQCSAGHGQGFQQALLAEDNAG